MCVMMHIWLTRPFNYAWKKCNSELCSLRFLSVLCKHAVVMGTSALYHAILVAVRLALLRVTWSAKSKTCDSFLNTFGKKIWCDVHSFPSEHFSVSLL